MELTYNKFNKEEEPVEAKILLGSDKIACTTTIVRISIIASTVPIFDLDIINSFLSICFYIN